MGALVVLLSFAVVFYMVFPGIGAFYVRKRWREFRRRLVDASLFPTARYERIVDRPDGFLGYYRFLGGLEAIQGDDTVWIRNGGLSVSAELEAVSSVYVLPSLSAAEAEGTVERNEETLPDEMPSQVPWNRIFSLPEGTQMLISGALFAEDGRAVFRSDSRQPLTAVIYDGDARTIMRRAIWGGRQRNEYWNQFTPISLVLGAFVLFILGYNFLHEPMMRMQAVTAVVLCLSPILPFLPPGVFPFFLYRYLWRQGRLSRAERDLLRLPLRYFNGESVRRGDTVRLPDGEQYGVDVFPDHKSALAASPRAKIRTVTVGGRRAGRETGYYAFGGMGRAADGPPVRRPEDPLAENLIIPGDPARLSYLCDLRARRFEYLAAPAFVAGYAANAILMLWLIASVFR